MVPSSYIKCILMTRGLSDSFTSITFSGLFSSLMSFVGRCSMRISPFPLWLIITTFALYCVCGVTFSVRIILSL